MQKWELVNKYKSCPTEGTQIQKWPCLQALPNGGDWKCLCNNKIKQPEILKELIDRNPHGLINGQKGKMLMAV